MGVVTDYDYGPDHIGEFGAYRCVCGIVVTSGGSCPRCREDDHA